MIQESKSGLRIAVLAGLATVTAYGLTLGREALIRWLEWLRGLGPVPFYGVFSTFISVGVPPTPFLLAAGAAFDLGTNLIGLLFAYSLSLAISYCYGNRLFRGPMQRFLERKTPLARTFLIEHPRMAIVLVRLLPGFPYVLQNCLLAAVCRSFSSYFLVSLAPLLLMASLYILVGRSAVDRNMLLLVPVLLLLLALALLGRHLTNAKGPSKRGPTHPP